MRFFGEFWFQLARGIASRKEKVKLMVVMTELLSLLLSCLEKNEHVPSVSSCCTEALNMDDHFLDK